MPTESRGRGEHEHPSVFPAQPTPPTPAPYQPRTRRYALVTVLAASFALAAWVASPLWIAVVLGVVMAISSRRAFDEMHRLLRERHRGWAAAMVTLGAGVLVAIAGGIVVFALSNELAKLVAHLDRQRGAGSLAGLVGERGATTLAELGVDTDRVYVWLRGQLEAATSYAATLAALAVRTTSFAVLGFVVALITMYYVLVDGPDLARRVERVAPLEPRHTRALLVEARDVARTAFVGTIATSILQGALAGAGYMILGVPQAFTWAVVTALASFVPVIGTALVWGPIAAYLVVEAHHVRAALMLAWGLVVVTSLVDYVIRPRLVGSHGLGHPLLTLIALLGGIEVFGLAGLVVAPIMMSVFIAAFRIYERELSTAAERGSA